MAKVITFSRVFPAYHPRKGQPTYFVEKFLNSVFRNNYGIINKKAILKPALDIINHLVLLDGEEKHHTIRAGNRWKVGEYFSPRVWSGKPYRSPQIKIAPDTEIKNIWDIEMFKEGSNIEIYINGELHCEMGSIVSEVLAENDGLSIEDLKEWFNIKNGKSFTGQIICWNPIIKY